MKVYHGGYMEISVIDLSKCEIGRDFGKGFYVTKIRKQAEFWAKRKGRIHSSDGIVTEYTFYDNAFENCNLEILRFDGYNEEWLDFVIANRRLDAIPHEYDIVEGPVANDDITQRIFAYLAGDISKTDFLEELKFKHEPSHQIAFCSLVSLQMLEWVNKKSDITLLGVDDAVIQSLVINKNLSEEKAIDIYFNSDTYRQLTDEMTELFKKPWQEIYNLLEKELK